MNEYTCVGTHTNGEMAIYLLFILRIKDKRVIMIITMKIVRSTFFSNFLIQKYYFHSVLNAKIAGSCFPNCVHFL